jgi:FkbM family methyltransferase
MKKLKRYLYLKVRSLLSKSNEHFAPHGIPIYIPTSSDLAIRYLLAKGRPYEEPEADMVKSYLAPNTNVIELGGCLGVISALIRKQIGPQAKHIIVEANPNLAAVCLLNAKQDSEVGATEVVVAAIDYSGADSVQFAVGNNAHVGHVSGLNEEGFTTPTVTLSKLAQRMPEGPFALICDIEGAEVQLFEKEQHIISRLSLLVLETHSDVYSDGKATQNEMLDQIKAAGLEEIVRSEAVICFQPI